MQMLHCKCTCIGRAESGVDANSLKHSVTYCTTTYPVDSNEATFITSI